MLRDIFIKKIKQAAVLLAAGGVFAVLSACSSRLGASGGASESAVAAAGIETATAALEVAASDLDSPAKTAPTYGGTLRLSMRRPATLNPLLNTCVTVDRALSLVFEPLFFLTDDLALEPNIASLYTPAEDGLSATITVAAGGFWHDGQPIRAADVVFSLDTLINAPDNAVYKQCAANIAGAYALTDMTVHVMFNTPRNDMDTAFTFPVLPVHYYQNEGTPNTARNMTPLGSGAFMYGAFDNDALILTAASLRRPYIDEVQVFITPDAETDIHAYNQDLTDVLIADYHIYNQTLGTKQFNLYTAATGFYEFLGFNHTGLLRNYELRAAAAHAIDLTKLRNAVYYGTASAAPVPVHPASWLTAPEPPLFAYDPPEAARLIAESGVDPALLSFALIVNEENPARLQTAAFIQAALLEVGIEVRVAALPINEYLERLETGAFDMFLGGFNFGETFDLSYLFHSAGDANFGRYANADVDALILSAQTAQNDLVRFTATADAQRLIAGEVTALGLAWRDTALLADADIKGVVIRPKSVFYNIRDWYFGN